MSSVCHSLVLVVHQPHDCFHETLVGSCRQLLGHCFDDRGCFVHVRAVELAIVPFHVGGLVVVGPGPLSCRDLRLLRLAQQCYTG